MPGPKKMKPAPKKKQTKREQTEQKAAGGVAGGGADVDGAQVQVQQQQQKQRPPQPPQQLSQQQQPSQQPPRKQPSPQQQDQQEPSRSDDLDAIVAPESERWKWQKTRMKVCSECRRVGYCSRACFVRGWPRHAADCRHFKMRCDDMCRYSGGAFLDDATCIPGAAGIREWRYQPEDHDGDQEQQGQGQGQHPGAGGPDLFGPAFHAFGEW